MNVSVYNQHCCGCGECYAVCPVKAIDMQINTQGFYYPIVDSTKCVDCSKCTTRCSFNNGSAESNAYSVINTYALKHIDEDIRAASRSGGVFTALSDIILDMGGVIYGCELQDCRKAIHTRATTKEQRDRFRGSKYIQSETYHIFEDIKNDVKNGLWVLFSGTSCQVNAVKDFCKDLDCSKLLLVDIVCHGVPSPTVWDDYLKYIEKKNKKKITSVDFRDKQKFGWTAHNETVVFQDGSDYSDNAFRCLFYSHLILREDCFECPYRSLNRISDITIADCWGIAEHYPEFDDDKGVSLVLINTNKAEQIFNKIQQADCINVDITKLMQPPLRTNWDVPANYDEFWGYYKAHSFKKVVDKYVIKRPSLYSRTKYFIRSNLARIYRKIVKR